MLRNLRYSLRVLRKNPGFALAAVLTMMLGIGASVVMFAALDAVILRPLPFRDPDRIVQIWETKRQLKSDRITVAFPNYENWRDENHAFDGMAFITGATYKLTGRGEPKKIQALSVSSNFFSLLGVAPRLGRGFRPDDERSGNVAILSDSLWKSQFGGDPRILGQSVELNNQAYTIIGVMPPEFYYPDFGRKWELWTPFAPAPGAATSRDAHFGGAVARLRAGATLPQAQADLNAISERLAQEFPSTNAGAGARLLPIQEQTVGEIRRTLLAMFAAVGLLLLIACSNVASLLMVRAAARRKEIGARIALGASRGNLISQLLTESLVLAGLGGLLGSLLASALLPLLRSIPVPVPRIDQMSISPAVLLFALLSTLLSGGLFGLLPALQLTSKDSNDALKARRSSLTVRSLVVAQIALAFVLLTGAGLLIESLARVLGVDPGFRAESVLTAKVSLSQPAGAIAREQRLLDQLRALPGVSAAGLTTNLPIGGTGWTTYLSIEGRASSRGEVLPSDARTISAGYLEAMAIPLARGRIFDEADSPAAPLVAVINDVFAKRYFPGEDPIGHRVKLGRADDSAFPWLFTIAGVVGSVRHRTLETPSSPELYMLSSQMTGSLSALAPTDFALAIRSRSDLKPLIGAIRATVAALDRNAPVSDIRPMRDVLSRSLAPREFNLAIFAAFAGLALLLAGVGIYGVMAYSTALRTREIGIRMALGSDRSAILRLVLGQGMRLAALGIALGVTASWFVSRLVSSMLYGVGPHSPLILAAVAGTMTAATLLAGCVPAGQAASVDPVSALRCD